MSDNETIAYVVRPSDYLEKLAYLHGFDRDAVWASADNAEVREARPNHNVLQPGDVIKVPPSQADGPTVQGGGQNAYAADVPRVTVKVLIHAPDGTLMPGAPCSVEGIEGAPTATDGDGCLTLEVPITMREVDVTFPESEFVLRLDVGGLDPETEESGIKNRLQNLGLYLQDEASDPERLANAITLFQRRRGLSETGAVDDDTRAALLEEHLI